MLRRYFDGFQEVYLPDRLEEFLGSTNGDRADFRFNLIDGIIGALVERLRVKTIDCADATQAAWFQQVWESCSLDALQEDIYESVLLEGEYFLIVEWIDGKIEVSLNERYTSLDVDGGTGTGCYMIYPNGDHTKTPICCIKQWSEFRNDTFVERRNVYWQDRVEKLERSTKMEWDVIETVAYKENVGMPIIHFINRRFRSEAWNALPMQDLTNKSVVDLASTSDQTAFRIYYALGFIPTVDGEAPASDGSNWMEVQPGQIIGTTKSKSDAEFGAIEPASIDAVLKMVHECIMWTAMVSQIPVSRFTTTGQVAKSETLKDQEGPLLAKATSRQVILGNAWVKFFELCRRLRNAYIQGEAPYAVDATVKVLWQDVELRNEATRIETLILKRELAVSFDQLWTEAGYTEEQRAELRKSEEYQRMLAALGPMPGEVISYTSDQGSGDNVDVSNLG